MGGAQEKMTREVIKSHISGVARKIKDALLNLNFREIMAILSMSYAVISFTKCGNATYHEVLSSLLKRLHSFWSVVMCHLKILRRAYESYCPMNVKLMQAA